MVRLHAPAFVMTVAMILTGPTHLVLGSLPGFNKALHCPRAVAGLTANEILQPADTSTADCEVSLSRPWTVQCAPYCGSGLQQQIYLFVVINASCCNIQRVAINTTTFSAATDVRRAEELNGTLSILCGEYRPFISGLLVIPGDFCGANHSILPDITVTLFDRCGSRNHCCQEDEVRVIGFTDV
ncbi:uncharacterized protein LOC124266704 [Haliotis rubra]|uniref:uncharacterized protein LOC124266704 n=1 Tax=Haliotis rubra TaxID=36100 RepID=UPI001EE59FE4|nr:uncharacterized protein LOC124266704 [Haliotis rubra]